MRRAREGRIGRLPCRRPRHRRDIPGATVPHQRRAGSGLHRPHAPQRTSVHTRPRPVPLRPSLRHANRRPPWRPARRHSAPCRLPAVAMSTVNTSKPGNTRSAASGPPATAALCGIGLRPSAPKSAAGEHGEHPWHRARPSRVDRLDARMGMRRANHCRECHVRQRNVRHIAAASGEEAHILLARDRLADTEFNHEIACSQHPAFAIRSAESYAGSPSGTTCPGRSRRPTTRDRMSPQENGGDP